MKSISYKRFFNQCESESRPFEELECDIFNQVLATYEDENSNFCIPDGADGLILTQIIYLAVLYMYKNELKSTVTYCDYYIGDDLLLIDSCVKEVEMAKKEGLSWSNLTEYTQEYISEYEYNNYSTLDELLRIITSGVLGTPKNYS